jgi:hypothetical protein
LRVGESGVEASTRSRSVALSALGRERTTASDRKFCAAFSPCVWGVGCGGRRHAAGLVGRGGRGHKRVSQYGSRGNSTWQSVRQPQKFQLARTAWQASLSHAASSSRASCVQRKRSSRGPSHQTHQRGWVDLLG